MKLILIAALAAATGLAQGPAATLIERLKGMSPEQRRRMLDRMPPERRELLENRISKLNQAAPEARERLKRDYEAFQQLPPEKQDEARRTLRAIADLPEDRRRAVRGAINSLRQQASDVQQKRLSSRVFADRYSEDERKLIRDAVALLPPPDARPEDKPAQNFRQ